MLVVQCVYELHQLVAGQRRFVEHFVDDFPASAIGISGGNVNERLRKINTKINKYFNFKKKKTPTKSIYFKIFQVFAEFHHALQTDNVDVGG